MVDWLLNDWCSTFMVTLGHFLWQGALIAVTLAVVMRAASSSAIRYRISLSALLLMAVCPVITIEPRLLSALERQAGALGLKLRPALVYCEHVAVPTVMGIFRPMVLLPLSLASGLTPDQMEFILAHELAHLRRYDHLVNLLQRVIESLLFFHPAVWWVSHWAREERELCCDDLVVACGAVPFDYAASLLRVAELSRTSTLPRYVAAVSLLATGNKPSNLRRRIARLLGESTAPPLRLKPRLVLLTIIGPLIFVVVALQSNASNTKPTSDETSEDETVGAFASDGIDAEVAALLRLIPEADAFRQVDAVLTLAKTKDKGGNRDAAKTLLALAIKMAFEMPLDGEDKNVFAQEELQSAALMQICRLTAEYNSTSSALELATEIRSPSLRVIALCQIAERQAEANSSVAALKTLEAASAAARQTPEIREDFVATFESRKFQRQMAFNCVVESLAKLRHTDAALTVIDEVAKSVGTANCYGACLTLLTAEIMADNNEGRDSVLAKIIQLDEAARVNPETPVLGTVEEFLKSAYIAAADEFISRKQLDRAEKLVATVRRNPGEDNSWSIDSLVMRLAIQRIKEDSPDVQIPAESDFLNRDSFLKFTALYGRELARKGRREQSLELIDKIVAESSHLKSDSVSAIPMIFAAHAFAILGDDRRAMETAEWIGLVPSCYANSSDWDDYGLPFQAMSCQASAMSLIAKAQLERGDADAASGTLRKIVIETTTDGKATSWYLERVKGDALVDAVNWLYQHGKTEQALEVLDSAETMEIRVSILSHVEALLDDENTPKKRIDQHETEKIESLSMDDASSQPIVEIIVEGNDKVDSAKIRNLIGQKIGEPATKSQARKDVRSLMGSRWFFSVKPLIRRKDAGLMLVYQVVERPLIERVEFRGNQKFESAELEKLTGLSAGSPFDAKGNHESAKRIEFHYRSNGLPHARVTLEKGGHRDDRVVIFVITENDRIISPPDDAELNRRAAN